MKFLSAFALISAVSASNLATRGLQLASDWDIGTPSVTWDGTTFTFSISHAAGLGPAISPVLAVHGRTTGPTNTWPDYACPTFFNDGTITTEGTIESGASSVTIFDNQAFAFMTGAGPYTSTYSFQINGPVIAGNSNVFDSTHPNDPTNALVGFCLLFGLVDNTQAANAPSTVGQVVSFREIGVELDIVLDGTFNIVGFTTEAIDPSYSINNQAVYTTRAYVCGADGSVSTMQPFDQLDAVPVCVCPTVGQEDDTVVVNIFSLVFTFGALSQTSISGGVGSALTGPITCGGSTPNCCRVETMLNAYFYPTAFAQQVVSGYGIADLNIGRRLKEGRNLEKAQGEFELGIAVKGPEDSESSAVSAGIAGAAALAGAALML